MEYILHKTLQEKEFHIEFFVTTNRCFTISGYTEIRCQRDKHRRNQPRIQRRISRWKGTTKKRNLIARFETDGVAAWLLFISPQRTTASFRLASPLINSGRVPDGWLSYERFAVVTQPCRKSDVRLRPQPKQTSVLDRNTIITSVRFFLRLRALHVFSFDFSSFLVICSRQT